MNENLQIIFLNAFSQKKTFDSDLDIPEVCTWGLIW